MSKKNLKGQLHAQAENGCLRGSVARMLGEADNGRRFAHRVIEDKRFRKPKHKASVFADA